MQRAGGIPDIRWAQVPHPLGSATPDVLKERAAEAVDQFVDIVVAKSEES